MSKKYSHIKIRLASPEEIRGWSSGEVESHETINYRTLKPEFGGLFCERIFGPTKDYQCHCGKSRKNIDKGTVCEKCGVEITESKVRRERMGHIELAAPVVHTWYLKNSPSRLATLLELKTKELEEVVYYASYIVTWSNVEEISVRQTMSEQDYAKYSELYAGRFEALTGAEAIKKLLVDIDLDHEVEMLRKELISASKQRRDKVVKRLEVCEAFLNSDNKPEWMILDVLPVIPPDIRPMVQLDGGRFAVTDLNDLYRRILNRNVRLKKQQKQNAPHLITKNEKRMLQEAVDSLIDNTKRGKKMVVENNRPLKSLSDMLRGKQGRFRQNLLGKRVDFSGRSVIVVGPDLEMHQCGLPKEMALTLFKPFVIREIMKQGEQSIMSAKRIIETMDDSVWGILEEVIREHPVLLNRAPTLHRLGIQAFEPKLIEGKAIRLHPLVTPAFNADFDGDQMAVHVPLSHFAQAEARLLMLASNNILNPKDGKPIVTPSQDMVLGNYYLTLEEKTSNINVYSDFDEAYLAYKSNVIGLHTKIVIDAENVDKVFTKEQRDSYLITTLGKLIFNSILPDTFPYLNIPSRESFDNAFDEYFVRKGNNIKEVFDRIQSDIDKDHPMYKYRKNGIYGAFDKKYLGIVIGEIFKKFAVNETSKMLDKLKDLGFKYSTQAGFTVSANDVQVYSGKYEEIEKADVRIDEIRKLYDRGLLTESERYEHVIKVWHATRQKIQDGLKDEQDPNNHIKMMAISGARGNDSNFSQLAGMRGLMNNTLGRAIEIPVKASFREGLNVSEFFISTHGARKGSTDTALKTAESGYLTRRLVDVSQDVIVDMEDCGTARGFVVKEIRSATDDTLIVPLFDRLIGRFSNENITNPETGEVIVARGELITNDDADEILRVGIKEVEIRSTLTCDSRVGVCKTCYGRNLATNEIVEVGEVVGIIAAQSIGEPGTQLTMRTFHTGGVASGSDITQGLPRIQELFEAREPKGKAELSEYDGVIDSVDRTQPNRIIVRIKPVGSDTIVEYKVPKNAEMLKYTGDNVKIGDKLVKGNVAPKELIRVLGTVDVQNYILKEVQKVYRATGVEISDKHIEIIIRQMLRKIFVVKEGETELLPSSAVSIHKFEEANRKAFEEGKQPAVGRLLLHGITRASLKSESFLSAASFQETTKILTDATVKGKKDPLIGLKENVIIGGVIPAGTGLLEQNRYKYLQEQEDVTEDKFDENQG